MRPSKSVIVGVHIHMDKGMNPWSITSDIECEHWYGQWRSGEWLKPIVATLGSETRTSCVWGQYSDDNPGQRQEEVTYQELLYQRMNQGFLGML